MEYVLGARLRREPLEEEARLAYDITSPCAMPPGDCEAHFIVETLPAGKKFSPQRLVMLAGAGDAFELLDIVDDAGREITCTRARDVTHFKDPPAFKVGEGMRVRLRNHTTEYAELRVVCYGSV